MKCLNCGNTSDNYLCPECTTLDVLEKIFKEIRYYKAETCENPYLLETVSGLSGKHPERNLLPDILNMFDFKISEYYYCWYYYIRKDECFEDAAIAYLNVHDLTDIRTQDILDCLLKSYIPNDFIKPKKWCDFIAETDALCCELYEIAAKYFAMIGEYDMADAVADKGIEICNDVNRRIFLFSAPEKMISRLEKQKKALCQVHQKRFSRITLTLAKKKQRVQQRFKIMQYIKFSSTCFCDTI